MANGRLHRKLLSQKGICFFSVCEATWWRWWLHRQTESTSGRGNGIFPDLTRCLFVTLRRWCLAWALRRSALLISMPADLRWESTISRLAPRSYTKQSTQFYREQHTRNGRHWKYTVEHDRNLWGHHITHGIIQCRVAIQCPRLWAASAAAHEEASQRCWGCAEIHQPQIVLVAVWDWIDSVEVFLIGGQHVHHRFGVVHKL